MSSVVPPPYSIKHCRQTQPMMTRDVPDGPLQEIATNFFTFTKQEFLLISNTFNKYPFLSENPPKLLKQSQKSSTEYSLNLVLQCDIYWQLSALLIRKIHTLPTIITHTAYHLSTHSQTVLSKGTLKLSKKTSQKAK